MAVSMTLVRVAAASGVARPAASRAPPPSAHGRAAASAWVRPGRRPVCSNASPVASRPYPAEPAEELLRAVPHEQPADDQPQDESSDLHFLHLRVVSPSMSPAASLPRFPGRGGSVRSDSSEPSRPDIPSKRAILAGMHTSAPLGGTAGWTSVAWSATCGEAPRAARWMQSPSSSPRVSRRPGPCWRWTGSGERPRSGSSPSGCRSLGATVASSRGCSAPAWSSARKTRSTGVSSACGSRRPGAIWVALR